MKKSSPEFRQLQRERIYKTKPWLNSTGAKTKEGKEISKMNALKLNKKTNELFKISKDMARLLRLIRKSMSVK